jgi:hypothetical protein
MKLTKTMRSLIERAQQSPRGVAIVQLTQGRGPKGGQVTHGYRESNALEALIKNGIAEFVKTDTQTFPSCGNTIWVYDTYYRLTETMPSDADYLAALGPCGK